MRSGLSSLLQMIHYRSQLQNISCALGTVTFYGVPNNASNLQPNQSWLQRMRWKCVGKSSFANKTKRWQRFLVLLYDPFIVRKELKRVLLLHGTAWAFTNLQRFYAHPCCGVRQHYSIAMIMPMRKILK